MTTDTPSALPVRIAGGWGESAGQLVEALFTALPPWVRGLILIALVFGCCWAGGRWDRHRFYKRFFEQMRQQKKPDPPA